MIEPRNMSDRLGQRACTQRTDETFAIEAMLSEHIIRNEYDSVAGVFLHIAEDVHMIAEKREGARSAAHIESRGTQAFSRT